MNPQDDELKQWEALVDRELKQLADLPAPATLLPRVLAAIREGLGRPWYRRAWQTWPRGMQSASLALLAALFGGLCLAGSELAHAAGASEAAQNARQWFSGIEAIRSSLAVLVHAAGQAVQHLGPVLMAFCVVAGLAAYLSCLSLGVAFVRLAVPRRENGIQS